MHGTPGPGRSAGAGAGAGAAAPETLSRARGDGVLAGAWRTLNAACTRAGRGAAEGVALQASVAGLAMAVGVALASRIADAQSRRRKPPLDPPCPEMEALDPDMADVLREFMGPFCHLCPGERRDAFRADVRRAIERAGAVLRVERAGMEDAGAGAGRVTGGDEYGVGAYEGWRPPRIGFAEWQAAVDDAADAMRHLRRVRSYFDTELLTQVHHRTELVSNYLHEHLHTIRGLVE